MKFGTIEDRHAFTEYMYDYQNAFSEYEVNQYFCYLVYGGEYFPKLINKILVSPKSYFLNDGENQVLSFKDKNEMLEWVEEQTNNILLREL